MHLSTVDDAPSGEVSRGRVADRDTRERKREKEGQGGSGREREREGEGLAGRL